MNVAPPRRRVPPRVAWALALVLGCAVVAVVTTGLVTSKNWRHQLALSFTHRPSNFAELYFATPTALPSTFEPAHPFVIRVGVTNVSDSEEVYTVTETAIRAHHRATKVGTRTLKVKAHAVAVLALSVELPRDTRRFDVALAGHPQTQLQLHLTPVVDHVG